MNTNEMKMEILNNRYNKDDLLKVRAQLYIEKMGLDKQFSMFLADTHHYDMLPEETDTQLWKDYKKMRKTYTKVDELISLVNYYIGRK